VVLVRPDLRRIEQEALPRLLAGPELRVVDPVVDHPHPVRLEAEELDRPPRTNALGTMTVSARRAARS